MHAEFLLERGEGTVERVGGIRYAELGVFLIGEKIGKICRKRAVCRADTLVGEVPFRLSVLERGGRLLADEVLPAFVPCGECCGEGRFVRFREGENKCHESFARLGLRPFREIPRHNLYLMELAHLYRNIVENVEESSSSVDHSRFEHPASFFKDLPGVAIVGHELAGDFVPPDVLRKRPGTEHTDAVLPAPEGGVSDDDGRMRNDLLSRYNDRVELFAYPDVRAPVLLCELLERLLPLNVFLPNFDTDSCIALR